MREGGKEGESELVYVRGREGKLSGICERDRETERQIGGLDE